MKRLLALTLIFNVVYFFGCSKVDFQAVPSASCVDYNQQNGEGSCVLSPDGLNNYKFSARTGEIEILFVNDNSGSMYVEQQKIARQFPGFLDDLQEYDYRIGMITTDISGSDNGPGPANGNGSLQDGKLVPFGTQPYLSNTDYSTTVHNSNISLFQQTITRGETDHCLEDAACPSSDERGIYALNMALDRAESSQFFRAGGHLAVVILSDEDERTVAPGASSARINKDLNPDLWTSADYKLQNYDLPETFVKKFAERFGTVKSLSVHSIIVKPKMTRKSDGSVTVSTGDVAGDDCLAEQTRQSYVDRSGRRRYVDAYYGTQYARLSKPNKEMKKRGSIVDGHIGNICADNYTEQMGPIADKIKGLRFVTLPCAPVSETLQITGMSPDPGYQVNFAIDETTPTQVNLTPQVPPGTTVHFEFKCPRS